MQAATNKIDTNMVFGIIVGVVFVVAALPFLIVWALISESLRSSKATARTNDGTAEDVRDEFGYKPGDIYYSNPGTGPNPILADLWEKSDETWYK